MSGRNLCDGGSMGLLESSVAFFAVLDCARDTRTTEEVSPRAAATFTGRPMIAVSTFLNHAAILP